MFICIDTVALQPLPVRRVARTSVREPVNTWWDVTCMARVQVRVVVVIVVVVCINGMRLKVKQCNERPPNDTPPSQ